jgi:hypothetical protein
MGIAIPARAVELGTDPTPGPLTERILARLPGSRSAWLVGWAAVPVLLTSVVAPAATRNTTEPMPSDPLRGLIFAYALLVSVWAARRFHHRVVEIRANVRQLMSSANEPDPFRGLTDTGKPLTTAGIMAVVSAAVMGYLYGPLAAITVAPFLFVANVAYFTAFWAYVSIITALHRIGGSTLALNLFPEDPTLGLRPLGRLSLTVSWVYLAVFLPALAAASNWVTFLVSFIAFIGGVLVFVLSLWRIHVQMRKARERYVAWARSLYAAVCQPVKGDGSLEALRTNAAALSAAEALERRADRIQRWPFEEGTTLRTLTIVTSVTAMAIARMLLAPLGL